MKKFTYEITIEAEHEFEAESRIRGLGLLTSCTMIPKREENSVLPLTETEEKIIQYIRKGEKMIGIIMQLIQKGTSLETILEMLNTNNQPNEQNHEKV